MTGHRFQNHSWHLTGLLGITLFLIALPLSGWAQRLVSSSGFLTSLVK
jgi:hypothetical protein